MLSNLYPTDTGTTYYQYELEYTQKIQDISGITLGTDFSKSYYMGYMPQDSFPETVFGLTMPRISDDNTTILLNNHFKENRPWGFCKLQETSGNNNVLPFQAYYFNASNQLSRVVSSDWANIRFINKLTLANLTAKDLISLTIKFRIVPTADLDTKGSGIAVTTVSWQNSISLLDLVDFVSGDLSFTCSISQSYVSTTKIIHYSDFDENTLTYHYTENGYDVYAQLQDFDIYSGHVYNHENNRIYDANIVPFYRTHIPEGYGYPEQDILVTGYNYLSIATDVRYEFYDTGSHDTFYPSSTPGLPLTSGSYNGTLNNFNIIRGKFPIDSVIASDVPVITGSGSGIVYNCLFIDSKSGTGGTFSFIPAIDFKDVLKAAFMRNCVYCGSDQSVDSLPLLTTYTDEEVVSYFNADDIPFFDDEELEVYEWGEQGDHALLSGLLRPWQLPDADITEDVFDVADMPEYVPPGPEPSEWGDDRYGTVPGLWLGSDGITANFITPWVLRGSQVTNFGQFLWENLFLPDPDDPSVINGLWQNFKNALGTYWQTGSFDPASVLEYVVSLLYYPFDLTSNSTDTNEKKIYFGIGALGLNVSSTYNTRRLDTYHGWLYGGGLNLNDADVKSSLGIPDDFRGLANTSACIYLPFCGTYQVNWADIRDSALTIYYAIDFTTGSCIAYVISSKNNRDTYVLTASGMVGFSVPLSATNANRLISSILGDVAQSGTKYMDMGTNIGTKIITGGQADSPSQVRGGSDDDAGNALTMTAAGGPVGSVVGNFTMAGRAAKELFSKPSIGIPMMAGGSGWDALHCPRTPYIQVRTPQYVPDVGHGHALGWPAEKQNTISSLPKPNARNYYECVNVDTSTLTCTHEERQMIKQQLETGFYISAE